MGEVITKEITGAQIVGASPFREPERLTSELPVSYATYRTMRKNPTIAMARALVMAPIIAGEWSVEAKTDVDDTVIELIDDTFLPIRELILQACMEGNIDFGWQPFEKVFAIDENTQQIRLAKLKPLLQDITDIVVLGSTGQFYGFEQAAPMSTITVPLSNSFLVSLEVEGTQWYGRSRLENIRTNYNEWIEANTAAARYDKRIAGAKVIIRYPPGTSMYKGASTLNSEVAENLLAKLDTSNMGVIVPSVVAATVKELNKEQQELVGWKINILGDSNPKQYSFVPRLEYLDRLSVRGLLIPERAILEGKFGTKADAGVHADLALTSVELYHKQITRLVNWHCVNQILALNFGPETRSTVWLKPVPLADEKIAYLREVYSKILDNDAGFMWALENMDAESLRDSLGIPAGETNLTEMLVESEESEVDEGLKVVG